MNQALRRVIGGLQIACFLFVHGLGSAFSIEIDHAHHGDAHHDHDFAGYHVASADSHPHDHPPFDSHQDEPQGDDPIPPSDSAPSPHSHLLCFNVAPAMLVSGIGDCSPRYGFTERFLRSEKEQCPDGPSFEVIKPPQLV